MLEHRKDGGRKRPPRVLARVRNGRGDIQHRRELQAQRCALLTRIEPDFQSAEYSPLGPPTVRHVDNSMDKAVKRPEYRWKRHISDALRSHIEKQLIY